MLILLNMNTNFDTILFGLAFEIRQTVKHTLKPFKRCVCESEGNKSLSEAIAQCLMEKYQALIGLNTLYAINQRTGN